MPSCKVLMDPEVLLKLIPYSFDEFTVLAHKFEYAIHNTTWHGTLQKNAIVSDVPASEFLFFTLFWLCNYPTLTLLSVPSATQTISSKDPLAHVEKVSCSNSSSEGQVISLEDARQCTGDTSEDLCTGTFMKMEEAREEGESRVVAEPE